MQEKHYFNTTGEAPETVTKLEAKAAAQDVQILAHFVANPFDEWGASDLQKVFPYWPITSIRRALTKLHSPKRGTPGILAAMSLEGFHIKQIGAYGRPEWMYHYNFDPK